MQSKVRYLEINLVLVVKEDASFVKKKRISEKKTSEGFGGPMPQLQSGFEIF